MGGDDDAGNAGDPNSNPNSNPISSSLTTAALARESIDGDTPMGVAMHILDLEVVDADGGMGSDDDWSDLSEMKRIEDEGELEEEEGEGERADHGEFEWEQDENRAAQGKTTSPAMLIQKSPSAGSLDDEHHDSNVSKAFHIHDQQSWGAYSLDTQPGWPHIPAPPPTIVNLPQGQPPTDLSHGADGITSVGLAHEPFKDQWLGKSPSSTAPRTSNRPPCPPPFPHQHQQPLAFLPAPPALPSPIHRPDQPGQPPWAFTSSPPDPLRYTRGPPVLAAAAPVRIVCATTKAARLRRPIRCHVPALPTPYFDACHSDYHTSDTDTEELSDCFPRREARGCCGRRATRRDR